jgi:hypothetical protein
VVRARVALGRGRLGDAVGELERLAGAPVEEPGRFASATATRVAVLVERNLLEEAQGVVAPGVGRLREGGAAAQLVELLERAGREAAARMRSAMELWELPFARGARAPAPAAAEAAGPSRFAAAWTGAANRVLDALERA